MDDRERDYQAALDRCRRENPEAIEASRELLRRRKWERYWKREYPEVSGYDLARATESVR